MIDASQYLFFLAGALALNVTPGPDMAFTMASATRGGARAGLAAAAGIVVGSLGWTVLTAAGLAALLAASEHAFTIVRLMGGAYLLYLAYRTFAARDALPQSAGESQSWQAFRSGFVTNLFNPKVGLFYLAFLPTFTDPATGPVWLQTLLLGTIFSVTGGLVLALVALAAGAMRERLAKSRNLRVTLNTLAATAFGALGLRLLLVRSP